MRVPFGLELSPSDLVDVDPQWLVEALWLHKVLVLRDMPLTRTGFVRLGQRFGDLELHPTLPRAPGAPEVSVMVTGGRDEPSSAGWHFDAAWGRPASLVTLLRNVTTPPRGGDTLFLDATELAKRVLMNFGPGAARVRLTHRSMSGSLDVTAPLLRRHPVTGEWAALVNLQLIRGPADLHDAPDGLVRWLEEEMADRGLQHRVQWLPSSIVIWDNLSTLHRLSFDFAPFVRRMERMSVAGTRPSGRSEMT